MKRVLCALAIMAMAVGTNPLRGDSPDDATKNAGVAAAQAELKKAQVQEAALEKEVADLKAQIAAAKAASGTSGNADTDAAAEPAKPEPRVAGPKVAKPAAKPGAGPVHIGEAKADIPKEFKTISTKGDLETMRWDESTVVDGAQLRAGIAPHITRWTVTLKNDVVAAVQSKKYYPGQTMEP